MAKFVLEKPAAYFIWVSGEPLVFLIYFIIFFVFMEFLRPCVNQNIQDNHETIVCLLFHYILPYETVMLKCSCIAVYRIRCDQISVRLSEYGNNVKMASPSKQTQMWIERLLIITWDDSMSLLCIRMESVLDHHSQQISETASIRVSGDASSALHSNGELSLL